MRIAPSRRLKKSLKAVTDDNAYFDDLQQREQYLAEMERCMSGNFGTMLIAALEQLESAAYSTLYKSSMKHRIAQAKAEIKTVQYVKGVFLSLRAERENLEAMKETIEQEITNEV